MAAPKGNEFWKARSKHGRNHAYSAEELLDEAERYFLRLSTDTSARFYEPITKQRFLRPPSVMGLCVHLGIGERTWYMWKELGSEDFLQVISYIETVIKSQQFDGAAIGVFKANIISRALGLVQKHEHTGAGGGPIQTKELSDAELARRLRFLARRAERGGEGGPDEQSADADGGADMVPE